MQGGILALDLAKVTGWAYGKPGARPAPTWLEARTGRRGDKHMSGSKRLGPKACSQASVFVHLEEFICDAIAVHAPSLVVFESPFITGTTHQKTARQLLGLAAVVELVCEKKSIKPYEVNNASVRKHFIGKGRGKREGLKALTIGRCDDLGWSPEDDNEADALAVLDFAIAALDCNGQMPRPQAEMAVVGW